MKKINASNIVEDVRRQPFNKASYEHIQEAFQEPISDILKGINDSPSGIVALYGCVNSGSGLNYIISAGSVVYNGEVFSVPAFTGTATGANVPVLSIVTAYRSGDPVTFSDNNTFNVHEIRTMVWTIGASGSGLCDLASLKRMSKANRDQGAWTNITLINGWTNFTGTLKYRIDQLGQIHLSGHLQASGSSSAVFANTPAALNNAATNNLLEFVGELGAGTGRYGFSVDNSQMSILASDYSIGNRYRIHGISFWPDENS
jgi:hypothetical protein